MRVPLDSFTYRNIQSTAMLVLRASPLFAFIAVLCCWQRAAGDTLDITAVKCISASYGSWHDELMVYIEERKVFPSYLNQYMHIRPEFRGDGYSITVGEKVSFRIFSQMEKHQTPLCSIFFPIFSCPGQLNR